MTKFWTSYITADCKLCGKTGMKRWTKCRDCLLPRCYKCTSEQNDGFRRCRICARAYTQRQENTMNKQETTVEYPYAVEYSQGADVKHEEPYTERPMTKEILDGADQVHGGTTAIDGIRLLHQAEGEYERCVKAWKRHAQGHWVGVPPTAETEEPVEDASPAPDIVKAEAPPAEPQPATAKTETFRDVTMYRTSAFMGNITRQDCREVTVQYGVKYAQYDNAVEVSYLEKKKRKHRGFFVTDCPFLVLVPTSEAIQPDSLHGKATKSTIPGVLISQSRYSSFDAGWTADFMAKLEASGATVLLDLSGLNTHTGEMKERPEPVAEVEPEVIEEVQEEPPAPACAHRRIKATVGKGFTCRDCHAQV